MASSVFLFPGSISYSGSVSASGFLAGDGSAAAPSYSFASSVVLGFFARTSAILGFTSSGVERISFSGGGISLQATGQLVWSATSDPDGGNDTVLSRNAAGKLTLTGTTPMFQLGGTTSSFPALKMSASNRIDFRSADDSAFCDARAGVFNAASGYQMGGIAFISSTAPAISSGFGTSPSVSAQNGTAAFLINVGTGGVATSGVITLPAATTGWILHCTDITAAAAHTGLRTVQTASSTTSATIESQNSAGAATAWAASSIVRIIAMGY